MDNNKFVVGWCGSTATNGNIKGLPEIIEGCKLAGVELVIQDGAVNPIPNDKMLDEFYSKISCYICASEKEGTPVPILEALSCGIPVITTRVGITSQVIKHGENGLFIPNREPETIAKAIKDIKHIDWNNAARKARSSAYTFSWDQQIKLYEDFFESFVPSPISKNSYNLTYSNEKYVALLVPFYNGIEFLPGLIKNLKEQHLSNTKIYFFNDGSTDNGEFIVRKLAPSIGTEWVLYNFKERVGIANVINTFIRTAKEPYILKQDVDDLCEPNRINDLLEAILEKEVPAVFGGMEWFIGDCIDIRYPMDWMYLNRSVDFLREEYQKEPIQPRVSFAQMIVDKNIFQDVIGYLDENLEIGEDAEIVTRYIRSGLPFGIQNKTNYYYRRHMKSAMSKLSNNPKYIWNHMPKDTSMINPYPKRNILLSTYFCGKDDPQGSKYQYNDISLIDKWYNSILPFSGDTDIIVFHDGLSEEFINLYPKAHFIYKDISQDPYSTNDVRFLIYYDYLYRRRNYTDKVLMTDMFDVEFNKNPFELMGSSYDLFCGLDEREQNIRTNSWMIQKMVKAYNKAYYKDNKILNAGVIGGYTKPILKLLKAMNNTFIEKDSEDNINMAVFNKCAYDTFKVDKILSGYPLTTKFKKYETDTICYIKHK